MPFKHSSLQQLDEHLEKKSEICTVCIASISTTVMHCTHFLHTYYCTSAHSFSCNKGKNFLSSAAKESIHTSFLAMNGNTLTSTTALALIKLYTASWEKSRTRWPFTSIISSPMPSSPAKHCSGRFSTKRDTKIPEK